MALNSLEEVSLEYPSLPMIVVSATEDMSDVAKALRFGIKDFLPKPIGNHEHLTSAIENTLDDTFNHIADQRDFSSQWFRVDAGDMPEEQELHWHLDFLQQNPSAARDLLHALLPDKDTSQGSWKCSYRLLQSTDIMPLVFDYAWLMNGQFAFYLVDSAAHEGHGTATTLLVRALFHDYLRNLKSFNADLKDMAYLLEKGISCSDCASPVKAMFGIADLSKVRYHFYQQALMLSGQMGTSRSTFLRGQSLGKIALRTLSSLIYQSIVQGNCRSID